MRDSLGSRLSCVVLVLACLGGCASTSTTPPPSGPARDSLEAGAEATPAAAPSTETPYGFLDSAGLTADQKTAIKAIADRRQSASALSDANTRDERFAALMKAATLDQTALATFFREGLQASERSRTGLVTDYVAIRELLTASQRDKVAAAIQSQLDHPPTPPSAAPNEQGGQGGEQAQQQNPLTAEQQALFAATATPPTDPRAVLAALATLMRTGESAALNTALTPKVGIDAQVAALVKAFASLTPAQRIQAAGDS